MRTHGVWKNSRKMHEKRERTPRGRRQRRGSAEGGEASPRSFASMCFAYCLARPATSERGAADLSRLRRVPAAEIETKSCGSATKVHLFLMLVEVVFDIRWRTWGAERAI